MPGKIKRFHVERNAIEGDVDIIDASLPKSKLQTDTITAVIPLQLIKDATGLAADSTGVKYTSGKFRIDTNGLKSAVLRATWTASAADSVTAIELYDETAAAVRASISGNTGTDTEGAVTVADLVDENLHSLRADVTTASATAGATTDVTYAILELKYGYS
jgi:hypothetical protein